jgi:hypothetical protein
MLPGRLPDRAGLSRLAVGHREAAAALTGRLEGPANCKEAQRLFSSPESMLSEEIKLKGNGAFAVD